MTGPVINLRRERKRRARIQAGEIGVSDRTPSGVSKRDKALAAAEQALAERRLAGHRIEPPPSDDA